MAEVSGGLLLGGIMIMMILCVPQAKTEYLMGEIRWEELTVRNVSQSFYGTLCAFSPVALLPFLLGNVEKYGSAGKTVAGGILTLGGILIGMELLLPAVLGYDRVAAESYPVLLCWLAQIFREMYWPDLTSCGWDFCFTACFLQ